MISPRPRLKTPGLGTGDRCPVCRQDGGFAWVEIESLSYSRCRACMASWLDGQHRPGADEELAHYRLHQNDPADVGYRKFLSKLATPLLARLERPSQGLDYGCGPGPALAAMLREAGHRVDLYDPFFQPDPSPLTRRHDFVTCTEVVEHFHAPAREFDRLATLLRPGGCLAVMTCFQTDDSRFADWHYRKDPTHVVFYREETFRYLAARRGWRCEIPCKDVVLMFAQAE